MHGRRSAVGRGGWPGLPQRSLARGPHLKSKGKGGCFFDLAMQSAAVAGSQCSATPGHAEIWFSDDGAELIAHACCLTS
jgi:hypothetical protein